MTCAAFSTALRDEDGLVLRKVSEIDLNGHEVVTYHHLYAPDGSARIFHAADKALAAFERERDRRRMAANRAA